jgi:hypothetical protein
MWFEAKMLSAIATGHLDQCAAAEDGPFYASMTSTRAFIAYQSRSSTIHARIQLECDPTKSLATKEKAWHDPERYSPFNPFEISF